MSHFVQLQTPHGVLYVRPDAVVSIGRAEVAEIITGSQQLCRMISLNSTAMYYILDSPENMVLLLNGFQ